MEGVFVDDGIGTSISSVSPVTAPAISHPLQAGGDIELFPPQEHSAPKWSAQIFSCHVPKAALKLAAAPSTSPASSSKAPPTVPNSSIPTTSVLTENYSSYSHRPWWWRLSGRTQRHVGACGRAEPISNGAREAIDYRRVDLWFPMTRTQKMSWCHSNQPLLTLTRFGHECGSKRTIRCLIAPPTHQKTQVLWRSLRSVSRPSDKGVTLNRSSSDCVLCFVGVVWRQMFTKQCWRFLGHELCLSERNAFNKLFLRWTDRGITDAK